MPDEPPIRIGLRVDNVVAATALYESFGFTRFAAVPDEHGNPLIAILRRGPLQLLIDGAAHRCPNCHITAGPLDAPWGERYVELVDPHGYAWKFFRIRA